MSSYKSIFTPPAHMPYRKWFTGKTAVLLIITILISVLVTRFFEKLHYDNLLGKVNTAAAQANATNHNEQLDLKYLISNTPGTLNCYQLMSDYAKQVCDQHNQALSH